MKDALVQVRAQLGPEAVILHSREIKRRRLFGLRRRRGIEITAATGLAAPERTKQAPVTEDWLHDQLAEPLHSLQAMVADLCRRKTSPVPDLPEELVPVYTRLVDCDVRESVASELVCRLRDELSRSELAQSGLVCQRLTELVQQLLNVSGPAVCRDGITTVVAVVGPTGVGKTLTVAKLAANFKLRQNLRVGMLTTDTYRIAAVEQLRTYAEIVDVPLKVVMSPREMTAALGEMSDRNLVLLDTSGRSPGDELRIKELRSFLQEASPSEIHLVLSSASSESSLRRALDRFAALEPNRLLLTKLDEAATLGAAFSAVVSLPQPLSYVTMGQNVPDDIHVADPKDLAGRIVEQILPATGPLERQAA